MNIDIIDSIVKYFSNPSGFFDSLVHGGQASKDWGFVGAGWSIIRTIFLALDVVLLAAFIVVTIVSFKYRPKLHPSHGMTRKILTLKDALFADRWAKIQQKFAQGTPDAFKIAIIDADKLADDALKRLGFNGEHMADRLEKIMPQELNSLNRLWQAHRLRNNLVHTPGFEISMRDANLTLGSYEAFLKEIKVIQ